MRENKGRDKVKYGPKKMPSFFGHGSWMFKQKGINYFSIRPPQERGKPVGNGAENLIRANNS